MHITIKKTDMPTTTNYVIAKYIKKFITYEVNQKKKVG